MATPALGGDIRGTLGCRDFITLAVFPVCLGCSNTYFMTRGGGHSGGPCPVPPVWMDMFRGRGQAVVGRGLVCLGRVGFRTRRV